MNYPLRTLDQLPLILRGFRQLQGYTQAAMAEKLGITQQSYAHFEANPSTATVERIFVVLRLLDVEISLDQAASAAGMSLDKAGTRAATIRKVKPSADMKQGRIISAKRKKESW